jgi:hypothetical protein
MDRWEKSFLKKDEVLSHFNNACTHRQMQITFRVAVKHSVEGHWVYGDLLVFHNQKACMINNNFISGLLLTSTFSGTCLYIYVSHEK